MDWSFPIWCASPSGIFSQRILISDHFRTKFRANGRHSGASLHLCLPIPNSFCQDMTKDGGNWLFRRAKYTSLRNYIWYKRSIAWHFLHRFWIWIECAYLVDTIDVCTCQMENGHLPLDCVMRCDCFEFCNLNGNWRWMRVSFSAVSVGDWKGAFIHWFFICDANLWLFTREWSKANNRFSREFHPYTRQTKPMNMKGDGNAIPILRKNGQFCVKCDHDHEKRPHSWKQNKANRCLIRTSRTRIKRFRICLSLNFCLHYVFQFCC